MSNKFSNRYDDYTEIFDEGEDIDYSKPTREEAEQDELASDEQRRNSTIG